jgi:hypothetical protein
MKNKILILLSLCVTSLYSQVAHINDGETGLSVRTKLNTIIDNVNDLDTTTLRIEDSITYKTTYSAKQDSVYFGGEIDKILDTLGAKIDTSDIPIATTQSAVIKEVNQTYVLKALKNFFTDGIDSLWVKIKLKLPDGQLVTGATGVHLADTNFVNNQIAARGSDTLNSGILYYDNPNKTYSPYPTQKSFISFDTSGMQPTVRKQFNINAIVATTALRGWAKGPSRGLTINNDGAASLGIGVYGCVNGVESQGAGKDFNAIGSRISYYSGNSNNYNAFESLKGSSTADCFNATHQGSGDAYEFLLSATSSGNAITGRAFTTSRTRNIIEITDTNNASIFNLKANGNFTIAGRYTNNSTKGDTILMDLQRNGVSKFQVDSAGHLFNQVAHYYSYFDDSTITRALTQNVEIQVTNLAKNLFAGSDDGFTVDGDTLIVDQHGGGLDVAFEFDELGVNNKTYVYRIYQKNGTTTEVYKRSYTSDGTRSTRTLSPYVHVYPNSKVWCTVTCTTVTPGNYVIYGGSLKAYMLYLNK